MWESIQTGSEPEMLELFADHHASELPACSIVNSTADASKKCLRCYDEDACDAFNRELKDAGLPLFWHKVV